MTRSAIDVIDEAVREVERLRKLLKSKDSPQVRTVDEQLAMKATALAWFESHKSFLGNLGSNGLEVDKCYLGILEASGRASSREKCLTELSGLRKLLIRLRPVALSGVAASADDVPPDFSRLVADPEMQSILIGRWAECVNCLRAPAPLAATVMMGGLLEGLLLARVNKETNQAPIFKAKAAPKDRQGKIKHLSDWKLFDFIAVAQELKWINVSTASVGHALRDYRNYIHPQKQLSDGVMLGPEDAALWWMIAKEISRQLLARTPQ